MLENEIVSSEYKSFEDINRKRNDGSEYWLARELQKALEYAKWENFSKVMDRAMLACKNAGFEVFDHFVEVDKTVEMPTKPTKNKKIRFS